MVRMVPRMASSSGSTMLRSGRALTASPAGLHGSFPAPAATRGLSRACQHMMVPEPRLAAAGGEADRCTRPEWAKLYRPLSSAVYAPFRLLQPA
jgi:hypothetical protein